MRTSVIWKTCKIWKKHWNRSKHIDFKFIRIFRRFVKAKKETKKRHRFHKSYWWCRCSREWKMCAPCVCMYVCVSWIHEYHNFEQEMFGIYTSIKIFEYWAFAHPRHSWFNALQIIYIIMIIICIGCANVWNVKYIYIL